MLLACAALIGSLCVPQEYVAVSEFIATYYGVGPRGEPLPSQFDAERSRRIGIHILAWRNDVFQNISTLGVDRVCEKGWCVYYRKHCDEKQHFCAVAQSDTVRPEDSGTSGATVYRGFKIQARDAADLRKIMAKLRFVMIIKDHPSDIAVPLNRFDRESRDIDDFIGCRRSVWVEGCGRPPDPELRRFEHHL